MKLRTMNEVSAAEGQILFQVAVDRGAYPKDIIARGFLECLKLYCEIMRAGVINKRSPELSLEELEAGSARAKGDVSEVSKILTEKELEAFPHRQRQILEVFRENHKIQDKEIGVKLGVETKTISNELLIIRKKLGAKNRKELAAMLPPPSNHPPESQSNPI